MPMNHGLNYLPSGVMLDGTEPVWIDKFLSGVWSTYQVTTQEIANLAAGGGSKSASTVLAGPLSGPPAPSSFRSLAWNSDIPLVSTLSAQSGIGPTSLVAVEQGGVYVQATVAQIAAAAGAGTVTSVGLTAPGILSVAGSPVTTAGTLALTLANQNPAIVFAGPTSGGAAAPTFRSLVWNNDLPLYSTLPSTSGLDGDEHIAVEKGSTFIQTTTRFLASILLGFTNIFTKNQSVRPVVANASGSTTPDATATNNWEYTQTGNLTLNTPSGITPGMVLNFELIQDATGGRTITLSADFKFGGGTIPTWITTANAKNFISGYVDSSLKIICGGVAGAA